MNELYTNLKIDHEMKWKYKNIETPLEKYNFPKIVALTLATRNIQPNEAEEFLFSHMRGSYNPFIFKSIEKIVDRLAEALEKREKILIHGDYDIDGITAAALLFRVLDRLGFYVDYYIPHRLTEGYGLSKKAIEKAENEGFSIILTVDTGITAFQQAYYAKFKGIDLIITDHHEPQRISANGNLNYVSKLVLPDAFAILNPKVEEYPDPNLAGVGVAYKLLEALYQHLGLTTDELYEELDLVVLGTVGDMVPLLKENRILVKKGLEVLTNSKKPGIQALKEIAGIYDGDINPYHISFILAPRINAAGRISHAKDSFELLITDDFDEAMELAENLHNLNNKRKEEERIIYEEAVEQIQKMDLKENFVIVLASEKWNYGVIGIAASKIVQQFKRPAVLITFEEDIGRGSVRSIEEVDIHSVLTALSSHLISFGGHKLACGLKIKRENLEKFKEALNKTVREMVGEIDMEPSIDIDGNIRLEDIHPDIKEYYNLLKPFGVGNPEPVFALKGVKIDKESIKVHREKHISFKILEQDQDIRGIFFDGHEKFDLLFNAELLDFAVSLNVKPDHSFELKIHDVKPSQ